MVERGIMVERGGLMVERGSCMCADKSKYHFDRTSSTQKVRWAGSNESLVMCFVFLTCLPLPCSIYYSCLYQYLVLFF